MDVLGSLACRSCNGLFRQSLRSRIRWNRSFATSSLLRRQTVEVNTIEDVPKPKADLAKIIRDSIKATGPIPVSRYMQLCLGHPTDGYYTRQRADADVFGKKGDFITSPEISQVFGELVAVWLITQWTAQGRPGRVRLVELGPGRGTLMDDVLRTLLAVPSFSISSLESVNLVETSLPLRVQQESRLGERIRTFGGHADRVAMSWYDHITEIPIDNEVFTMVLAHEFFDALPINIFQKTEDGFREVYVNVDPEWTSPNEPQPTPATNSPRVGIATNNTSGLTLALSRTPTTLSQFLPATSPRFTQTMRVGDRAEISSESWNTMRSVGELVGGRAEEQPEEKRSDSIVVKTAGGAALVMDYGDDHFFNNSFRAFRGHQIVNVFDDPGSADLTANVDFAYLKESLAGVALPHGHIVQRDFLISLGLGPRLDRLLQSAATRERKVEIAQAARRLVDADGMGGEYKFLGVTPPRPEGGAEPVYPFEQSAK